MATRDEIIHSPDSGRPIELYEFGMQSLVFRYTSADSDVVFGGFTYLKRAIARESVIANVGDRAQLYPISLPSDDLLAQAFIPRPPPITVSAVVFEIEPEETPTPTRRILFSGSVRAIELDGRMSAARLQCTSLESELGREFPRDVYSALCNNVVYDERCQSNPALHQFVGTATALGGTQSGPTIRVPGSAASGHDFKGGTVSIFGSSSVRMVIKQGSQALGEDPDDLTIVFPFDEVDDPIGKPVTVTAGCDHQLGSGCAIVHDNVRRFRGKPYVPTRSIFATGLT